MASGLRVKRLKDMVDRIERLPASEARDRLLSEVRSRAVDVDTGVTPRAMLPLREPAQPPKLRCLWKTRCSARKCLSFA
jgi:hypothetical protein